MKKTLLLFSFLFIFFTSFSQTPPYTFHPDYPTEFDGVFLRNQSTGQVYQVMEGRLRYIQTVETLHGLYDTSKQVIHDIPQPTINTYILGSPISTDSGFIRYTPTQQVYFREGNLLRWVYTIECARKYDFNLNIAVNVNSLAGYGIGNVLAQ